MSTFVTRATSRPKVRAPHHHCLEKYSSKVKRRSTAIIFRVLDTGCARRSDRQCAFDGSQGTQASCRSDQALKSLPVTEQSSPQVTRGMFALKSPKRDQPFFWRCNFRAPRLKADTSELAIEVLARSSANPPVANGTS